jgi:hypothetical protein
MTVPTKNSQVVAQGLARLTSGFQKPNIRAWLAVCLQPWQDIENATWDVLTSRFLKTAVTYTLPETNSVFDSLGAIVTQPRHGLSDVEYRSMIILRVAVNRSTGRTIEWGRFARIILRHLATGGVSYFETSAALVLGIWGFDPAAPTVPIVAAQVLSSALPNGVGGELAYSTWPDGADFSCSSVYDTSAGQAGFGSVYSATAGGPMVAVTPLGGS